MIVIIDADALLYQSSKEDAISSINEIQDRIVSIQQATSADKFILALSSNKYFRKVISPSYKAKRKPSELKYLKTLKSFLKENYKVLEIEGLEADDLVGFCQKELAEKFQLESTIASTDKDVLKTIPGKHWDYYHATFVETTEAEAIEFLLTQWITGDSTDNIPGVPGKGEKAAEKALKDQDLKTSIHTILDMYVEKFGVRRGIEEFYINFKMVYILKSKQDLLQTIREELIPNDINDFININPLIKTEW